MPCQVVNSQSQLQARLPTLPATMPQNQQQWTSFMTSLQQWGMALQQPPPPANILPLQFQTFNANSATTPVLGSLSLVNCSAQVSTTAQYYNTASLEVFGITSGATLTFSGYPISLQPATRWYGSFHIYAPSGCTGSITVKTSGGHSVTESFSVASSPNWQQVWGLFDFSQYADTQATWQFTFTSTAAVYLDGLQMSAVGKTLAYLPSFGGTQQNTGLPVSWQGYAGASITQDGLSKTGGIAATWDAYAITAQEFPACYIAAKPSPALGQAVIGLSTNPFVAPGLTHPYYAMNYALYVNASGNWEVVENGSGITVLVAAKASDRVSITYDGTTVTYYLNGVSQRTVTNAGQTFYGMASFYDSGSAWGSVEFAPLATVSQVSPNSGHLGPTGSTPPIVVGASFGYSTTSGQVTISWSAFTLYRMDGSTVSVNAGSQLVTGLTNSDVYTVYPYVPEGSTTVAFATGYSGAAGSPAICYLNGSAPAAAQMYNQANIPLSSFTVTPLASGGGGGGNRTGCLHCRTMVQLADGTSVPAGALAVGDELPGPGGPTKITRLDKRPCWAWWSVRVAWRSGYRETVIVTPDHRFLKPDHALVAAHELKLGDILAGDGHNVQVVSLDLVHERADLVSIDVEEPHLYYVSGVLSHNGNPKP